MNKNKRLAALLLALILVLSGVSVCFAETPADAEGAAKSPEEIRERKVLRVGTAGDYQPMSYLDPDTGKYVGFDAELAEDLAAELGVELEYVKTSWPTLMEDTLAGKFDLAICGITITRSNFPARVSSIKIGRAHV